METFKVFENIDHVDLPDDQFHAVMDCFCEKTWSNTPLYFNAGFFVYEPHLSTYHDLLDTLQVTNPTTFAEQLYIISHSCFGH